MTDAPQERVLITGSGGNMGRMLRARLAAPGRTLRLLNRSPVTPAGPDEAVEIVTASVTDFSAVVAACEGVDAIIHLGGLSGEAPFEDILHTNVLGSHHLLEAARRQGVRKVLLASSNHAVGYFSRDDAPPDGLPADLPPRPDSLYGWSKTAVESLGRLYADTYPLDVYCLRIGSCFEVPFNVRHLSTWLSPDDSARLINACLSIIRRQDISKDPESIIEITNYIFYFDKLNEDALIYKCKSLILLKRHTLANNAYQKFSKEYKDIYGEDFGKPFHEIIN